jgi:hypothetical protein
MSSAWNVLHVCMLALLGGLSRLALRGAVRSLVQYQELREIQKVRPHLAGTTWTFSYREAWRERQPAHKLTFAR